MPKAMAHYSPRMRNNRALFFMIIEAESIKYIRCLK